MEREEKKNKTAGEKSFVVMEYLESSVYSLGVFAKNVVALLAQASWARAASVIFRGNVNIVCDNTRPPEVEAQGRGDVGYLLFSASSLPPIHICFGRNRSSGT